MKEITEAVAQWHTKGFRVAYRERKFGQICDITVGDLNFYVQPYQSHEEGKLLVVYHGRSYVLTPDAVARYIVVLSNFFNIVGRLRFEHITFEPYEHGILITDSSDPFPKRFIVRPADSPTLLDSELRAIIANLMLMR